MTLSAAVHQLSLWSLRSKVTWVSLWVFCLHDTHGQYLALSKIWLSCFHCWFVSGLLDSELIIIVWLRVPCRMRRRLRSRRSRRKRNRSQSSWKYVI